MKSVLVVDDEKSGRNVVKVLIEKYFSYLEIIGECDNINDAENFINNKKPDIVLLDVKMPNGSGLELLQKFSEIDFAVIFITAHEEFALKALKLSAIDYLLKPISKTELEIAIQKSLNFLKLREIYNQNIKAAINNQISSQNEKILVINKYKNESVVFKDICYIKADSNYSTIYTAKRNYTTSKTLKEIEELVCDETNYFIRIHKSSIVNYNKINKCFERNGAHFVILIDGEELEISKRRWVLLRDLFIKFI